MNLSELVHRVVLAASLQGCVPGEVLLVVVAEVTASHVLVLDRCNTLTDLLALHVANVGVAFPRQLEVALGQVVGRQRGSVVRRQGDEVVEDTGASCTVALEGAGFLVGELRELGAVVVHAHEGVALVCRDVLTLFGHLIECLLAEVERPVERRAVVVHELGIRDGLADAINHTRDLLNVRLLGLNPEQVGTVLQRGDAVEHAAILAGSLAELEEVAGETLRAKQLAVALYDHIAVAELIL